MQELNLIGVLSTGGSGILPVIEPKNITANGTYTAPEGVDGYSPVTVNVPQSVPLLEDKYINENGLYGPSEGYDGIRSVNVDVPVPSIVPLTITENGTYESSGGSGFNPITVNVPQNSNMYSSNNDQLRLYENVFNGISILSFNGLYINQTMTFNDIDNEYIKNKLTNITFAPIARVFNSSSQTASSNQIGIDPTAQLFRYYNNNLASYDAGTVYGSVVLINSDLISGKYRIQVNPNIGGQNGK